MKIPQPKYNIGDKLHYYGEVSTTQLVECKVCKGETQIILADGRRFTCGYCNPSGKVQEYIKKIRFNNLTVCSISITIWSDKESYIRYYDDGTRRDCNEEEAYLTLKEAKEAAKTS